MFLAEVNTLDVIVILAYLLLLAFLGWLGYSRTKNAADYMVAGRKAHPAIMALSYGATFISTSAIVGFGGVAGTFGMSLLWLTFLNIFVGIFIAFVVMGGRVRNIGHRLDAHTFPELIGRRFQSKGIQVFAGALIFLFIPLYAAAVIIGGTEFICTQFGMDYATALLIFALIVAAYVLAGGLKAVMYTDALQGVIMFVGMAVLLVFAYYSVGGVTQGHQTLTDMKDLVPANLQAIGHQGWTAMPKFGFGELQNNMWWIVISTIVLGVGIGVLAQPQLCVRFMTVRSKRELNRAVLVGGIFILAMTGVAFTVGALSNVFFVQQGTTFKGLHVKDLDKPAHASIRIVREVAPTENPKAMVTLANGTTRLQTAADVGRFDYPLDVDIKGKPKINPKTGKTIPRMLSVAMLEGSAGKSQVVDISGEKLDVVNGRSIALANAKGNSDSIIPEYIKKAMPPWFGMVFLLTMLAAAMSTLSSQFHASGTSLGHDVYGTLTGNRGNLWITRAAIIIGLILAVALGLTARGGMIIARATAIFFGLCGSAFLPTLIGGLYFRRMTRAASIASIAVGFVVTSFWLMFVKSAEAEAIGLVQLVTGGKTSILAGHFNWDVVDPIVIALPLSALAAIIVTFMSKPPSAKHLDHCFGTTGPHAKARGAAK